MPLNSRKLIFRSLINGSCQQVMDWHLRNQIEKRLFFFHPRIEVLSSTESLDKEETFLIIRAKFFGFIWKKIVLKYYQGLSNESFKLKQIKGPFVNWSYHLKLKRQGKDICEVLDQIDFEVSRFKISSCRLNSFEKMFLKILKYKQEVIQNDFEFFKKYLHTSSLKILVSGAHGFIGKHLCSFFCFNGDEVWRLSRLNYGKKNEILWNPRTDLKEFEGFDAIIHLAGENIGKGRWTNKKKRAILESRYKKVQNLTKILSQLQKPPKTFICASAVGYYGHRGDEVLTEESAPGQKLFLSKVCLYLERAAREIEDIGIRVINARFGMVLSPDGGMLKKMLPFFRLGLGGKIDTGNQYISWIAIDDLMLAMYHLLMNPSLKGPVNCVSPYPITNRGFVSNLAKALCCHLSPPLPPFLLHLLYGEKAKELLLPSTRAYPKKLLATEFHFSYPTLDTAFSHLL